MSTNHRNSSSRRFTYFIIGLVIVVVAVIGLLVARHIVHPTGWNDENSFAQYAQDYQEEFSEFHQMPTEMNPEFGEPLSYAIASFSTSEQTASSDGTIQQAVLSAAEDLRRDYAGAHDDIAEDNAPLSALLIDYETCGYDATHEDFPYPTYSVALHQRQVDLIDDEEVFVDLVDTLNFATEDGTRLQDMNIWTGDWTSVVAEALTTRLQEDYGTVNQEAMASAQDDQFSKYILTQDGVKFFFDDSLREATSGDSGIVEGVQGVVSVTIPYADLETCLRRGIGERVIDPEKPMVSITYDDGPHGSYTDQILDVYEKNKAVCTFFELGQNVDGISNAQALLRRELELGCEIGTHSYDHPNQFTLSKKQIRSQAKRSKEAIYKAVGQNPTVGRPPYGNGNEEIAKIYGIPLVNWNVDTLDWESKDADRIVQEVQKVSNLDGCIVLMHSIHEADVGATERIVPWLMEQGYQLVTVSELLQFKYDLSVTGAHWYGYTFAEM